MRFLADLALFVEVANTRNFSRAAVALGMPVSTLSRRISALERELGFHLIYRSTRAFQLTDAGQATSSPKLLWRKRSVFRRKLPG
jgi:DNA-binding transcriptional LysR family regulator